MIIRIGGDLAGFDINPYVQQLNGFKFEGIVTLVRLPGRMVNRITFKDYHFGVDNERDNIPIIVGYKAIDTEDSLQNYFDDNTDRVIWMIPYIPGNTIYWLPKYTDHHPKKPNSLYIRVSRFPNTKSL